MRKVLKSFLFVLVICLFASCQNPSKNDNQLYFSEGWWKFSTLNTSVYLEYDTNKNITRAGTFDKEYVPTIVENMNKGETNKWDTYAKNFQLDSRMKFEKVSDADLPEWAKKTPEPVSYTPKLVLPDQFIIKAVKEEFKNDASKAECLYFCESVLCQDADDFYIEINGNLYKETEDIKIFEFHYWCIKFLVTENVDSFIFRIYDSTLDVYSNYCEMIVEKDEIKDNDASNLNLLVGTWTVDSQYTGLYDTIDFYSDGSGKCYSSRSSWANTFTWTITHDNNLKVTNMIGQTGETTFEVSLSRLHITSFIGVKEIWATKQ